MSPDLLARDVGIEPAEASSLMYDKNMWREQAVPASIQV